jgi:hypothetical protein
MQVIEAQCPWSRRLTITLHINQIRATSVSERSDQRAWADEHRGRPGRPEHFGGFFAHAESDGRSHSAISRGGRRRIKPST